jgi:hypothetical protein
VEEIEQSVLITVLLHIFLELFGECGCAEEDEDIEDGGSDVVSLELSFEAVETSEYLLEGFWLSRDGGTFMRWFWITTDFWLCWIAY